ncbi:MAG: DUF2442 domain-containing protein [Anaerolinea sp.]|nr:DUF2442 domain-containing protein [Anaerolinea sp.]
MLIDVVRVTPGADFTLELEYDNGERRLFDARPLLAVKPWTPLSNWSTFRLARVEYGTVTWPGDLDIAPETLYDRSRPINGDRVWSAPQQQPA